MVGSPKEKLRRLAFRTAAIKVYLNAYEGVMASLEAENQTHLLVQVVNRLLERMLASRRTVIQEAAFMAGEMSTEKGRAFVFAAAVDIALNDRLPGSVVFSVPTRKETYARTK